MNPRLAAWVHTLADLGGGRIALVAGGGGFADVARQVQAQWHIDEVAAHNMAVLAMAQSAMLLRSLEPRLVPVTTEDDIRAVLRGGEVALWMPYSVLREHLDELTTWAVSADSLALRLARRLNAERLVVVKSCPIDPAQGLPELCRAGVLDGRFADWSCTADFAIDVVDESALPDVRRRLIGPEVRSGAE